MADYDVVVVGAGPAGLSAAQLLGRCLRRVLVIDDAKPRNRTADHLCCFLTRDGTAPGELLELGRAEAIVYGVKFVLATAIGLDATLDEPAVALADGRTATARQVIVATGATDVPAGVPGLAERWGRDVVSCPYCHGFDFRDQPVGVLGSKPNSVPHALSVSVWSRDLIFFRHDLPELSDEDAANLRARGIVIQEGHVSGIRLEGDRLAAVVFDDGTEIKRSVLFAAPSTTPNLSLITNAGGTIEPDGETSLPHVWVAHTAPKAILAAAHGVEVAIGVNQAMLADDVAATLSGS